MLPGMDGPDRTRDHASKTVTDRDHIVRLSFPETAARLGITVAAVRMRAHRGTLKTEHVRGERFVLVPIALLDAAEHRGERETHASARVITASDRDALIAAKDSEIAYLRQSLDEEREARRRADHLLAGALERLAALPETDGGDADVAANKGPGATEPPTVDLDAGSSRGSFWSRLIRLLAGD
jgi:hypothetical protein